MIIYFRTLVSFLLFFTVFFEAESYAVPAYDGFLELKQPSGAAFKARQHGDEWYHWVETKDGYGIYKNTSTGAWEYYVPAGTSFRAIVGEIPPAEIGISKGLRPKKETTDAKFNAFVEKISKIPGKSTAVSGTISLLAIGVDYADSPATYTAEQIQPILFGTSNSVSDYYDKVSYSSVTVTPATESYETSDDGFIGWLRLGDTHPNKKTAQIAKDAILAADPYIDFASYDTNENDAIDPTELSIIIIVAGYEKAYESSSSPSVWAHYGSMSGVGYPSVDGKTIREYAQFGEKHEDHLATIGVIVHELGHLMFSLPDLYDTDTSNGNSGGIGYFDLMSSGSWGCEEDANPGAAPTQLSAWCKEYLSWGTVTTLSSSQTVSFPNSDDNTASVFRINTIDSNQYFLLENRQFTGYDIGFQRRAGASGHGGLVIYHIDTLKTNLWPSSNRINADVDDKGVDAEEANEGSLGYSMLDTFSKGADTEMFFFSGNNASFADTTTPDSKLKNGSSTDISITDISDYGDTMTASVTLPVRPPIVVTGAATDVTADTATLNGTVNANGADTTVWFEYGMSSEAYDTTSSTQEVNSTGDVSASAAISGLSGLTTYYYRIAAQNSAGTTYGSEMSFATQDGTPPAGLIIINSGAEYTNFPTITLTLSATDNVGITGYYVSTNPSIPSSSEWISVTSGTSYSTDISYILDTGDGIKTVYAWFKDASGNVSNTANDSVTLDITPPTITISSPTSDALYTTTSNMITLGGSASDGTSGISRVEWSNGTGGSGIASETTNWSASDIPLLIGDNVITISASDAAGNTNPDTITVTYVCKANTISADSGRLHLKKRDTAKVTVTLSGDNNCFAEGETVTVKVGKAARKGISVLPASNATDSNGQASFTIKAKSILGKAKVTFSVSDIKTVVNVKVK